MARPIVLLFACLALATVAKSNPISNGEVQPACKNCENNEVSPARPKRQLELGGLFQSIGGMVTNIMHEARMLKQQRIAQTRPFMQQFRYNQFSPPTRNEATYIGNGEGNTNHITYNIYNNRHHYK